MSTKLRLGDYFRYVFRSRQERDDTRRVNTRADLISTLEIMSRLSIRDDKRRWLMLERRALRIIPRTDVGGLWREVKASGSQKILLALRGHPHKRHRLEYAPAEIVGTHRDWTFNVVELMNLVVLRDDLDDRLVNIAAGNPAIINRLLDPGMDGRVLKSRPDLVEVILRQHLGQLREMRQRYFLHCLHLSSNSFAFACAILTLGQNGVRLERSPPPLSDSTPSIHAIWHMNQLSSSHEWIEFISRLGSLEALLNEPSRFQAYVDGLELHRAATAYAA